MAQFDPEQLKNELRRIPTDIAPVLAVRVAMRILPVLIAGAGDHDEGFDCWANDKSTHLLALFRSYQATLLVNALPDQTSRPLNRIIDAFSSIATATSSASAAVNDEAASKRAVVDAARAAHTAAARCLEGEHATTHIATADAAAAAAAATSTALEGLEADLGLIGIARSIRYVGGLSPPRPLTALQLLRHRLWPSGTPRSISKMWKAFEARALSLDAGFEIWLNWYWDRLEGKPLDIDSEQQWTMLSKERLDQSAGEINAYLQSLRAGTASQELNRVRAIFLGHGGAGKTSVIKVLHGDEVVLGEQPVTKGIAIQESVRVPVRTRARPKGKPKGPGLVSNIHESAGVFTRLPSIRDKGLTVHFWDFGGQVMAHATHQFFLRARCLCVIVLDGREEWNANEEAEYWLEHVRAFGDRAPVMLVGNKADLPVPVNVDLRSLKEKHPNIVGFYPLSCTEANKKRFKAEFQRFSRDFYDQLKKLGVHAERFTEPQYRVLKEVQNKAFSDDFLSQSAFDEICNKCGIPRSGPSGRGTLRDLFDKLGIIIHFPTLPYITDYMLNSRWLTYGVYTIMYSDQAQSAMGRIREQDVVSILNQNSLKQLDGRALRYAPDRCSVIVSAMVAFRVAYRRSRDANRLVIPALLEAQQPQHSFKAGARTIAFQLNFTGFLPRHVLPTLIVDRHEDIAQTSGEPEGTGNVREIVWQNGVLLQPRRRGFDAEALVKADYHERNLDILVNGADASAYLGLIRDDLLRTLQSMPELRVEERIQLRPELRVASTTGLTSLGDPPVWIAYGIIRSAQKNGLLAFPGPDGHLYDLDKTLAVLPVRAEMRPAEIFISYAHGNRELVDSLAAEFDKVGLSVWFDRELIAGQKYRKSIDSRIDVAKAVIVIWSDESIDSQWVIHEASRANDQEKLICVRQPGVKMNKIPAPFAANLHITSLKDLPGIMTALGVLGVGNQR